MKICIIGCSNSSGSPIGYVTSKFKESEKKYGSVWGFDRNKGWVAEFAKQYPNYEIHNWSTPGTGFSTFSMLLNLALIKKFNLIIVQNTQFRCHVPLFNYKLEDYKPFHWDSPNIPNLHHKWVNANEAVTLSMPGGDENPLFKEDSEQRTVLDQQQYDKYRENTWKILNNHAFNTLRRERERRLNTIGFVHEPHWDDIEEWILNFKKYTGWQSIKFMLDSYRAQLMHTSEKFNVRFFQWSQLNSRVVKNYIMDEYKCTKQHAVKIANEIMLPGGGHWPDKFQSILLDQLYSQNLFGYFHNGELKQTNLKELI